MLQVQVMAGKDKGEQGKVVAVMRKKQEILVEGLNCVCTTRYCIYISLMLNNTYRTLLQEIIQDFYKQLPYHTMMLH